MKPPKCPGCGEELDQVHNRPYIIYSWSSSENTYKIDRSDEIFCPLCNALLCNKYLEDLFPDGIENYHGGDS
jgi:hypothetical protein